MIPIPMIQVNVTILDPPENTKKNPKYFRVYLGGIKWKRWSEM